MSYLRILVTGSRNWTDIEVIAEALGEAISVYSSVGSLPVLVHGGARGADSLADEVWQELIQYGLNLLPAEVHPAQWSLYGRSAGHRRNAEMVALGAAVCLAFPLGESRGTRGCMRLAAAAGIPVVSYEARVTA